MSKKTSLKQNYIMNSLYTASAILFPLVTFPYVSRVLGPEGTGLVSFASSITAYFTILAQVGIPVYGIRECARVSDDRDQLSQTVTEIFTLNLITCAVSCLAFLLMICLVPRVHAHRELFLISGLAILLNFIGAEWLYKGLEQYTYIAVRSILFKACAIAAVFLLIRNADDYRKYAGIMVFALYGSYIVNFINLKNYLRFPSARPLNLRRHMKPILILFAMSASTTLYTHLDAAMLGFLKSDAEVGFYSTATNIKALLVNFIASLGTVLMPRVSYYLERGMTDEFYRLARKAIHFVMISAVPLSVYFMIFAPESILLIAGPKFASSVPSMVIIMPAVIFIGLTNVMGIQMMIPLGQEKKVMESTLAGAMIDAVINLLLIPHYAAAGAAVGTLIAEIAVFVIQFHALRQHMHTAFRLKQYLFLGPLLLLCTVVSVWTKFVFHSCFLILLLSAVCFFGLYAAILLYRKEPICTELAAVLAKQLKRLSH